MTPLQPDIRPFEAEDLPALQQIRKAAFAPIFRSFAATVGERIAAVAFASADAEQARFLDDLCKPGSAWQVLVVEAGGHKIGFTAFALDREKRIGEIGLNAVHPDHAGRGVGTALYEAALARMKAAGMIIATVGTGGDPGHAPARRAYSKAGFDTALPSLWLYRLL